MKKIFFILASVLLLFSSCKTQEKVLYFQDVVNQEAIATQVATDIKFEPGDKMSIVVSSPKPELAAPFNLPMANVQAGSTSRVGSNQISLYTIDSEGYVEIPVVGKIKIGGLSRSEATEKIQSALRDSKLLIDAVVTINVYEQYISVLGEVKNPSRINVTQDNITLLEALAQVGDLTIHARRDRILVLRKEGNVLLGVVLGNGDGVIRGGKLHALHARLNVLNVDVTTVSLKPCFHGKLCGIFLHRGVKRGSVDLVFPYGKILANSFFQKIKGSSKTGVHILVCGTIL
jgi:polysaccharide export outer membrane protein